MFLTELIIYRVFLNYWKTQKQRNKRRVTYLRKRRQLRIEFWEYYLKSKTFLTKNPIDNNSNSEPCFITIYHKLAYISLQKEEGRIVTIFILFYAFTFIIYSLSLFLFLSLLSLSLCINDWIDRWLVFPPPSFAKPNNAQCFLSLLSSSSSFKPWWKVNEFLCALLIKFSHSERWKNYSEY